MTVILYTAYHHNTFKHDVLEMVWCKKGKILVGLNGNLPFLISNDRNRSSFQNTAHESTKDTGQCPK
jgi:hypothetical protein